MKSFAQWLAMVGNSFLTVVVCLLMVVLWSITMVGAVVLSSIVFWFSERKANAVVRNAMGFLNRSYERMGRIGT